MKRLAITAIALCALAMAGCARGSSRPPTAHANLDMYDPPTQARRSYLARAQKLLVEPVSQPMQVDSALGTAGSASPAPAAVSLEARREKQSREDKAREEREAERLKRVTQICRAC
jgi:hypothetical protein